MTDDLSDLTPMQRQAIEALRHSDPRNVEPALVIMREANKKRKRRPPRTMRDMQRERFEIPPDEAEKWYP